MFLSLFENITPQLLIDFLTPQPPAQLLIYETSREVSEEGTVRVQERLPQDILRWDTEYFELKLLGVRRTP